jgi:lipopolysaccharide biosynthesis protein
LPCLNLVAVLCFYGRGAFDRMSTFRGRVSSIGASFLQSVVCRITLAGGILSRFRQSIIARWDGADPNRLSKRHAVYVHFDAQGNVAEFVVEQLRELSKTGFRITFVSNSPRLSEESIEAIIPFCREISLRRNTGYDFGAYRDGILSISDLRSAEYLVLANDSVYGPLFPLDEMLGKCDPAICDVWGATDSEEIAYHLQSYFLVFCSKAIKSSAFRRFWFWFPNIDSRKEVIKFGEIGLSQQLMSVGLRIGAVFKCADAETRKLRKIAAVKTLASDPNIEAFLKLVMDPTRKSAALNPTQVFWEELVIYERYPFLKRDLLRDNLWNVPTVLPWRKLLADYTSYDSALIEKHMNSQM